MKHFYDVIVIGGGHVRDGAHIMICMPAFQRCHALAVGLKR